MSISKFVMECVEEALSKDDSDFISRNDLIKRVEKLERENKELRKQVRLFKTLADRLDKELRLYGQKNIVKTLKEVTPKRLLEKFLEP